MIERIHWGRIGVRCFLDEPGDLFAVWPEPVDADGCFEEAGFNGFADSDESWDAEFETILQGVLATFQAHGSPIVTGDPPVLSLLDRLDALLFRKRVPELRLSQWLALVTSNDNFTPCRVDFGAPVRASVFVSDGHPIVWIWLHESVSSVWQDHLNTLAAGRNIIETTLRWDRLLPVFPWDPLLPAFPPLSTGC
jgi:hypothetical protein